MLEFVIGGAVVTGLLLITHAVTWASLKNAVTSAETDLKVAISDVKGEVTKLTQPAPTATPAKPAA